MSPEAKKEKFDSNTGLKNTSFDFNTINYPVIQKKVSIGTR